MNIIFFPIVKLWIWARMSCFVTIKQENRKKTENKKNFRPAGLIIFAILPETHIYFFAPYYFNADVHKIVIKGCAILNIWVGGIKHRSWSNWYKIDKSTHFEEIFIFSIIFRWINALFSHATLNVLFKHYAC